jgi:ABC-2 type transport system ATP-binding protein
VSTASPPTAALQASGLTKVYRVGFLMNRRVTALSGLDLSVEPGQIYGLLGPNGAGKSTTLKILMNLVQPTAGSATLFGRAPDAPDARREVGFLPENPAPYEYLTGVEFVTLAGKLAGLSGHGLDTRVQEVLGQVDLAHAQKLQVRRYSKGMVQRLALAQAIVHRPKLLVLDEPTSGLDPLGRRQMRDLILEQRALGTTVLFCTHIIPDVEALCDRVVVLVGGKRVREGRVQELVGTQASTLELTVEGLDRARLEQLGVKVADVHELEGRLLVRTQDADSQGLLRAVLAAGGRVSRLQPTRFTLEELFVQTVKEAGRGSSVGGEMSL